MEPQRAGLKMADWSPIMPTMASISVQLPVHMPAAPRTMAPTSSALAPMTMRRLGNRSASQPTGAPKTR